MSRVPSSRRRIRSAFAIGGVLCGALVTVPGAATASPLDPDRERELAQAHFQVHLLTHTDLRPSNITCTTPSGIGTSGDLVCYAIVDGNTTISALATPNGDLTFDFAAITKSSAPSANQDTAPVPAASGADAEAYMADFENDVEILESMLNDDLGGDVTVEQIAWQPEFSTLSVELVTADGTGGHELAWIVTDLLAGGWEPDSPLRAPDATVQPRLEVVVDGEVYGTPYEVMVSVADYAIDEAAWLEITTQTLPVGTKQPSLAHATAPLHTLRRADDLAGTAAGVLQA